MTRPVNNGEGGAAEVYTQGGTQEKPKGACVETCETDSADTGRGHGRGMVQTAGEEMHAMNSGTALMNKRRDVTKVKRRREK